MSEILGACFEVINFVLERAEAMDRNIQKCNTIREIVAGFQPILSMPLGWSFANSDVEKLTKLSTQQENLINYLTGVVKGAGELMEKYSTMNSLLHFFLAKGAEEDLAEVRNELVFIQTELCLSIGVDNATNIVDFRAAAQADHDNLVKLIKEVPQGEGNAESIEKIQQMLKQMNENRAEDLRQRELRAQQTIQTVKTATREEANRLSAEYTQKTEAILKSIQESNGSIRHDISESSKSLHRHLSDSHAELAKLMAYNNAALLQQLQQLLLSGGLGPVPGSNTPPLPFGRDILQVTSPFCEKQIRVPTIDLQRTLQREDDVVALLKFIENHSTVGESGIVGVCGLGGMGKTVMCTLLCHRSETKQRFPDGIFWLECGSYPSDRDLDAHAIEKLQSSLAEQIGIRLPSSDSEHERFRKLQMSLKGRTCLLVMDDVWVQSIISRFKQLLDQHDAHSCTLISTRDSGLLKEFATASPVVYVPKDLTNDQALELLKCLMPRLGQVEVTPDLSAAIKSVIEACGRLPLALAMISKQISYDQVRDPAAWKALAVQLQKGAMGSASVGEYKSRDLFNSVADMSLAGLNKYDPVESQVETCYLRLAVFPPDTRIPLSALEALWCGPMVTKDSAAKICSKLCEMSLLQSVGDEMRGEYFYSQHDLLHYYVARKMATEMHTLHEMILSGYERLCNRNWSVLADDGYIFSNIVRHWYGSRRSEHIVNLLLSHHFMMQRINTGGITALISDLEYVVAMENQLSKASHIDRTQLSRRSTDRHTLQAEQLQGLTAAPQEIYQSASLLLNALRASLATLTSDPDQVAPQMLGRLERIKELPQRLRLLLRDLSLAAMQEQDNWIRPIHSQLQRPDTAVISATMDGFAYESAMIATADGEYILTGNADGTVNVHDRLFVVQHTFVQHRSCISAFAVFLSPTKVWQAVSADESGAIFVWDIASGNVMAKLRDSRLPIQRTILAISGDGGRLVVGDELGVISIYSLVDKRKIAEQTIDKTINCVAVNHQGTVVLTGCNDAVVRMWDFNRIASPTITELRGHIASVLCCIIAPSGQVALSGSEDTMIIVWDLVKGTSTQRLAGHRMAVCALAISSNGTTVLSAGGQRDSKTPIDLNDCALRVWDLSAPSQRPLAMLGHSHTITSLTLIENDQRLGAVTGCMGAIARVWRVPKGLAHWNSDVVRNCELSRDCSPNQINLRALCDHASSAVTTFELSDGHVSSSRDSLKEKAASAISGDGLVVALSSGNHVMSLHKSNGVEYDKIILEATVAISSIDLNHDGSRALIHPAEGAPLIIDVKKKNKMARTTNPSDGYEYLVNKFAEFNDDQVARVCWSEKQLFAVIQRQSGVFEIHDLNARDIIRPIVAQTDCSRFFLTADCSSLICSLDQDHIVVVVDVVSGERRSHLHGRCLGVTIGAPCVIVALGNRIQIVDISGKEPKAIGQYWVDSDVTAAGVNMLTGDMVLFDASGAKHVLQWITSAKVKFHQATASSSFTGGATCDYCFETEIYPGSAIKVVRSEVQFKAFSEAVAREVPDETYPSMDAFPLKASTFGDIDSARVDSRAQALKKYLRAVFAKAPFSYTVRRFLFNNGTFVPSLGSKVTSAPAPRKGIAVSMVTSSGPLGAIARPPRSARKLAVNPFGSMRIEKSSSCKLGASCPLVTKKLTAKATGEKRFSRQVAASTLHAAVYAKDEKQVEFLVTHKRSPNVQNRKGDTPLHLSAYHGYTAIAKILCENNACINVRNVFGRTPLMIAARWGHTEVCELLLKAGADPTVQEFKTLKTAAILAMSNGQASLASRIFDAASQFSGQNLDCMRAILGGESVAFVSELLPVCARDKLGPRKDRNLLHFAAEQGDEEMCAFLVEHKDYSFSITGEDSQRVTPITQAAASGKRFAVCRLLSYTPDFERACKIVPQSQTLHCEDIWRAIVNLSRHTSDPESVAARAILGDIASKYQVDLARQLPKTTLLAYGNLPGFPLAEAPRASFDAENIRFVCADNGLLIINKLGELYAYNNAPCMMLGCSKDSLVKVSLPASIVSIATSIHHCLAITDTGDVLSWGVNLYGECGIGIHSDPVKKPQILAITHIFGQKRVVQVACGLGFSGAITEHGGLYLWGSHHTGASLLQSRTLVAIPTRVDPSALLNPGRVIQIAAGAEHMLVLTENRTTNVQTVLSWGKNDCGQLGAGLMDIMSHGAQSVLPAAADRVCRIACGPKHSAILCDSGNLFMAGVNAEYQLGNGTTKNSPSFALVQLPTLPIGESLDNVSLSLTHTVAVTDRGRVLIWGSGMDPQFKFKQRTAPCAMFQGVFSYGKVKRLSTGVGATICTVDIDE